MADQQSTPEPPEPGAPPKPKPGASPKPEPGAPSKSESHREPEPMTRERAIELLKTDVPAWNKWRADRDLSNARDPATFVKLPDLSKAELDGAHLEGANLRDVHLERAQLWKARLEGADLRKAHLQKAPLWKAHLEGAKLSGTHFEGADLAGTHLEGANLAGTHLEGADLHQAHLEGADLRGADFSNANVTGVAYDRKPRKFRGIRVATCYGHALFVRDARDPDYIETVLESLRADRDSWKRRKKRQRRELDTELRGANGRRSWSWRRKSITAWRVTSREWVLLACRRAWMRFWSWIDYGRSLLRVGVMGVFLAVIFGCFYSAFPSLLCMRDSAETPFTPFYYSIVTLTTLGFGDVTPKSLCGEVLVTVEVIAGYVTLGLLVSILANKVARRA